MDMKFMKATTIMMGIALFGVITVIRGNLLN